VIRAARYLVLLPMLCLLLAAQSQAQQIINRIGDANSIPIEVKDSAGLGASGFPVHVVVPLADGDLSAATGLRVEDASGQAVPAQFSVLNRWWARDSSIRHLLVQFPATVGAYQSAGSGIANYRLTTGTNPTPADPVAVTDSATNVRVRNSRLNINITRSPFSIATPSGNLAAVLRDENNAVRPTFERDDITVRVEENGPVRAIVRMSAPTRTEPDGSILHGWAMRLYAYAGQSHVKLDVQLQNAALDSVLSGPLYMESFELQLSATGVDEPAAMRRAELSETELTNPVAGALVKGRTGLGLRQFYETWPNGVRRTDDQLVAELFPAWSENQTIAGGNFYDEPLTPNGSGLFWLEDMQSVIKEVVLDFGSPTQTDMENLLRRINYPPIAVLPLDHYRDSAATLDLGGYIATDLTRPTNDDNRRIPNYRYQSTDFWLERLSTTHLLGWDEFLYSPTRKRDPRTAGGWPNVHAHFIVSGNPQDYFIAADRARGELNVPPQWLPGFNYARDQSRLQLTENPYRGPSWRKFDGNGISHLRRDYLPGTEQDGRPRDDQHGWFYYVEQSYWFTADPWVRDWYEFVAEFRKVRLNQADPFPDMSGRAVAHALNHAIQAHRVTGDMELLSLLGLYVRNELLPRINSVGAYTGQNSGQVASWQTGYLLRSLIDYLEELPGGAPLSRDANAASFIDQSVQWNIDIANFADWRSADEQSPGVSAGTGLTLVDPQLWYAAERGDTQAREHVADFLDAGVNGGTPPYGNFGGWSGGYEGRFTPIDIDISDGFVLASDQWRQISLPCNPGTSGSTNAVFGDDGLGTYGSDWILWAYNPATGDYDNVGLEGVLQQGVGYWIIQRTGSTQTLRLPPNCSATPVTSTAACSSAQGCFAAPLVTQANAVQWSMIGYPFNVASSLADVTVVTDAAPCAGGCNLPTSQSNGITSDTLWTYNGEAYSLTTRGDSLQPWLGYWSATLQEADGVSPRMLFPTP